MTENVQVANAPYNPTPEEIKTKKYERKLTLFKERLEAQLEMKQAELEAKDKRISFMEASKQFEEHVLREELEEVSKDKQDYYRTVKTQISRINQLETDNRRLKERASYFEQQTNRDRSDLHSQLDQKETQIQELTAELSETISIESYEAMRNKYYETKEIKEELETKIKELDTSTIVLGDSITHQAKYIKGLQDFLTKKGIDYQKENFKIELTDNRKKKRKATRKGPIKD